MRQYRYCAALLVLLLLVSPAAAQKKISHVDSLMTRDPLLPIPAATPVFPKQLKPLWLKALKRPESDIVQVAADTIAIAHQRGMPDLEDTAPLLMNLIKQPHQTSGVTRAAAHALIEIDARQAGDLLWELAQRDELDLAQLIEPALARWDYEPARQIWLSRLHDPLIRPSMLRLAIKSLAITREQSASNDLLQLVVKRETPASIRLAAARALAAVGHSNVVNEAEQLVGHGQDRMSDVLAATILSNDTSPETIALLRRLAQSRDSSAAVIALEHLYAIDPSHLLDLAEDLVKHQDAAVRRLAAQSLASAPNTDRLETLASLLQDVNLSLRTWAGQKLVEFGQQPEWNEVVIANMVGRLDSDSWRDLEQAMAVLARLDHKPIAQRLVLLLDHERPEVFITAAWALREIQVPESLEPMLDKAERLFGEFQAQAEQNPFPPAAQVIQLSQLFQAFGVMKWQPSEPLLREFVPKIHELGDRSRTAACWSLGYLYEDNAPDDLVQLLIQRALDRDPQDPELPDVRLASAISLGRMRAKAAIDPLRHVLKSEGPNGRLGQACGWALEELTGEPRPEPRPRSHRMTSWFLTPILD